MKYLALYPLITRSNHWIYIILAISDISMHTKAEQ